MRGSKGAAAAALVVLVLALGGGLIWYLRVPHTPQAQLAYAEQLDKQARAEALTQSVAAIAPKVAQAAAAYRRVGERFGKTPQAAEALKRMADLEENVAKDDTQAAAALGQLEKDYPDEADAGFAMREEARLLRKQADALKTGKPEEAVKDYHAALDKLEAYRKTFASQKGANPDHASAALMEEGRIWMDGLGDPLIRPIEIFQQVLKDYPQCEDEPEAMFRLAELFEKAKDYDQALMMYAELLEKYPRSKWSDQALFARGKILDQQMKKHEEAAKQFEKLQRDFPQSPLSGQAAGEAHKARSEEARAQGESYGKSRYGGAVPYDTVSDKPLPPSSMFAQFVAEKLDAEKYDLTVTFAPADHRITVDGTLKLKNRGDDKKELLLMLGDGLTLSKMTAGGVPVKFVHEGETLKLTLATPLKKGAETELAFDYTGQYASPDWNALAAAEGATSRPAGNEAGAAPGAEAGGAHIGAATRPAMPKYPVNPQIYLGEYGYALSGASWYPVTIIGDIFDAHVVMNTPPHCEAVTNGALVRREPSTKAGTPGVFEFQTRNPVFGLYFAYGPYVVQEKQLGNIHFYGYFRPEHKDRSDKYINAANEILTFYGGKFVPFPYAKMAMIEAPLPPFLGGVGPASMMLLQEQIVAQHNLPDNLLAHELAHQWFGNLLPINITDPGYNQWLSEGFATYCDALFTEHSDGHAAFVKHIEKYDQLFFQFEMTAPPGQGAIRDTYPGSPLYRPVIYEKGALVLHMLRKVMGDDEFFALMRKFVETYRNKPTTVDEFEKMAGQVYGQDLSWFFAQWIDRTVFAHWKLDVKLAPAGGAKADPPGAAAGGGATQVTLHISQPDDLVRMPADITLYGPDGARKVLPNVMLNEKDQTVTTSTPFKPTRVIIDEDYWVLHHPGADNQWPPPAATATTAP